MTVSSMATEASAVGGEGGPDHLPDLLLLGRREQPHPGRCEQLQQNNRQCKTVTRQWKTVNEG